MKTTTTSDVEDVDEGPDKDEEDKVVAGPLRDEDEDEDVAEPVRDEHENAADPVRD